MQYISIKKAEDKGKEIYVVPAIALKNTSNSVVQKIPHPLGTDTILYDTLEAAKEGITLAGFSYILPDGQRVSKQVKIQNLNSNVNKPDYEQLILNTLADKLSSSNASVVASAITALSEFPTEETFDILFDKIGEDNEQIRKNSIAAICRYSVLTTDRIIEALNSPNWVARNSALTCIQMICEDKNADIEKFIIPITERCNDNNPIVQSSALITLAKVYAEYKKR